MADISISILGLGRIGTSIGLALKRYNSSGGQHHFEITGYDSRPSYAKSAKKMDALDKSESRIGNAARKRDIIVISLPYAEVKTAYEVISPNLRDGAVILDTSVLKKPSLQWAEKYLSEETHLIGVTPIVNPAYIFDGVDETKRATEDLFDSGTILLMPRANCAKEAVELAANFSTLLGAAPHFLDPVEFDGLVAATEGLPSLLNVVYFYSLLKSQGWNDIQRVTNPAFGMLTSYLFDTHPDDLRDNWLNNRENLLRHTDGFIEALQGFRNFIAENDQNALEAVLVESAQEYEGWINRRHNASWDDARQPEISTGQTMMGSLFGSNIADRLTGKNKDD